jgi:UDP-N-acetylglucosamine--dolichyl-phosphate N-acetylglucosaminephosphotransferase
MLLFLSVVVIAFLGTLVSVPVLIRKFKDAGIAGPDVHKPHKPMLPEMGGLGIVAGFVAGVLFAVALATLTKTGPSQGLAIGSDLANIFAAVMTILIIAIIGIFDDLVRMRQSVKALLPIFASMPLVAIAAGSPYITLPLVGRMYLPLIYPLILIPLGFTVASNVTNMLAGFNGLEAGMGLVACSALAIVAWGAGSLAALILMLSMVGALAAFLIFNWYPARIFPGDVGTLSIGAAIAAAVIIGNFEMAGVVVLMPYLADFIIKARNRFPKEVGLTRLRGGHLTCERVVGLPSLIMNSVNGISEKKLVMVLILTELVFGIIAVLI